MWNDKCQKKGNLGTLEDGAAERGDDVKCSFEILAQRAQRGKEATKDELTTKNTQIAKKKT